MGIFSRKSEEEKWAAAKGAAHERRAERGQKVTKSTKALTPNQQIKDQAKYFNAKNKRGK